MSVSAFIDSATPLSLNQSKILGRRVRGRLCCGERGHVWRRGFKTFIADSEQALMCTCVVNGPPSPLSLCRCPIDAPRLPLARGAHCGHEVMGNEKRSDLYLTGSEAGRFKLQGIVGPTSADPGPHPLPNMHFRSHCHYKNALFPCIFINKESGFQSHEFFT